LYYERFGVSNSFWSPYFALLPTSFSTLFQFDHWQRTVLAQSTFSPLHESSGLPWNTSTAGGCDVLARDFSHIVEAGQRVSEEERARRCDWVNSIVRTRMYAPRFREGSVVSTQPGDQVSMPHSDYASLIPVLDLFNAVCTAPGPSTAIVVENGRYVPNYHHVMPEDAQTGDEIFEAYHDCEMLPINNLLSYGFVESGGVRDSTSNSARLDVRPVLHMTSPLARARILQYLSSSGKEPTESAADFLARNPGLQEPTLGFIFRDQSPLPAEFLQLAAFIPLRTEEDERWIDAIGRHEPTPLCLRGRAMRISLQFLRDARQALFDRGVGAIAQVPNLSNDTRTWDPRLCEAVAVLASELKTLYFAEKALLAHWTNVLLPHDGVEPITSLQLSRDLSASSEQRHLLRPATPHFSGTFDVC
jgi:hypothetical protein